MATPTYNISKQQTVAGQLDDLLKQDNPYMKQARSQGQQYANSRGLLNSSIGAQASQDAAIQNALPVAQADAATHNTFKGKQYDTRLQKDVNNQVQGYEQANMKLGNSLQKQLNSQLHGYDKSILKLEQNFAHNQNQAKFDQDWRMQQAQSATEREIASLEQQSLQFAQFTKGVADINAADMKGSEKDAAVASLWTQYTKGSSIADSIRNFSINDDGSVNRTETTSTDTPTSTDTSTPKTLEVSYIYGDGGVYMPGITANRDGELVDKSGDTMPTDGKAASYYSEGYTYELSGGVWVKKTLPKLTDPFASYGGYGQ